MFCVARFTRLLSASSLFNPNANILIPSNSYSPLRSPPKKILYESRPQKPHQKTSVQKQNYLCLRARVSNALPDENQVRTRGVDYPKPKVPKKRQQLPTTTVYSEQKKPQLRHQSQKQKRRFGQKQYERTQTDHKKNFFWAQRRSGEYEARLINDATYLNRDTGSREREGLREENGGREPHS